MSLTRNAVFIACLLSLASPGVKAGPVTMKLLWSSEKSPYIYITFTDTDFQQLYLCMAMDSTAACLIGVFVIYPQDALVTSIQRRQADVNDTLSSYFTCAFMPSDMNVVCNRRDTTACTPNTPRTSFHLYNQCCHQPCVWLLWSDVHEQLYDNNTIEICDSNCTPPVTIPPTLPTAQLLNESTLGHEPTNSVTNDTLFRHEPTNSVTNDTLFRHEPTNSVTKDTGTSSNHHGPSLIVSLVVACIIAVDIIVVIAWLLYKRRCGRGRTGDMKVTEKTINTESFRTLTIDLPRPHASTDQTRVYSSLDFVDGATADQHIYVKMSDSCKSQRNPDENSKHTIYQDTELCKPIEATYHNSSDTANKKQHEDIERTYSTIADSYAILEDLRDESAEVNRPIKICYTADNTYVDLHDESAEAIYITADTEMDGNIQSNDCNISDTNIYANTEVYVPGESLSSSVDKDLYTNVTSTRITTRF